MQINLKNFDSSFHATNGLEKSLIDYQGTWLILYFYPKDSTPGCTTEGCEFNANYDAFKALNAEIFGISKDSLSSHEKFKAKQGFRFELISDFDGKFCDKFEVMKEKNMYGKTYLGIERSTFLINPQSEVVMAWRQVKVPGHVLSVLDYLKQQLK
jgi:peroxiredoxin Q/BCP